MSLVKTVTPPMGWNSWDCYGTTVTEDEVLANARFMAEHLLAFGWDTVVVDIDWSDPTARSHGYNADAPLAMDDFGRLLPDVGRFPSSADGAGFGPLAAQVHALGLKFGIHTMRGIPRRAVEADLPIAGSSATAGQVADRDNHCSWNPDMFGLDHDLPGAQDYYDSTLALYAEWGVDFIKCDDMLWPYQARDIAAYHEAIERSGRAIALSLSPGRDLSAARVDHLREHATMWRICDDLWDRWSDVEANFARFARWAPLAGQQGWPDGDMLPLGRIGIRAERGEPRHDGLTQPERISLLTLWLIARSPLMIGGDLPSSQPETVALFRNAEALEVRHAVASRELIREGSRVVWSADGPDGQTWIAVFNLADQPSRVVLDALDLGLAPEVSGLTDVWTGREVITTAVTTKTAQSLGVAPGSTAITVDLEAHGAVLVRVSGR